MDFQNDRITIAVSKGRISQSVQPLLEAAGVGPLSDMYKSRSLVFETHTPNVELIVVRSTDVPTYVRQGGADLGIVGKDVLLELDGEGYYELVDLCVSRCELVLAEKQNMDERSQNAERKARIATKYANTTRRHFARKGVYVEVIKLYGSVELAPLCDMADRVVDLSQSGETLRSNGLKKVETIASISARLIANKASMRLKEMALKSIARNLESAAKEQFSGA
ncbi:MAG: ATP phosphoribosyltransferase [Gammaproteobacteria bacterium]|nr:ATP phosphoribosyltransferase [Gammaproteobacteria bacterium]